MAIAAFLTKPMKLLMSLCSALRCLRLLKNRSMILRSFYSALSSVGIIGSISQRCIGLDAIDEIALQPPVIAPIDRLEAAEKFRQILPSRARAGHPKKGSDETPIVGTRSTLLPGAQRPNSCPQIVT